jgi:Flp pilus assembly pilin Flp
MNGLKQFLREELGAVITAEYVIFLAAIGIILVVGIAALFGGLQNLFNAYSTYFQPPS